MSNTREESKQTLKGVGSWDSINTGSLQRIADAAEKMAEGFNAVLKERDDHKIWRERYCRYWQEEQANVAERNRTISALRGQLTKLKKRLAVSNG